MKKKFLMMFMIILFLCMPIRYVSAYLKDGDQVTNTFRIGGVHISIHEEFIPSEIGAGKEIRKKVWVTNDGPNDCFVRMRALPSNSDFGKWMTVDWNLSDWIYNQNDGYYYYKYKLNSNQKTSQLFSKVSFHKNAELDAEGTFEIIVYAEACHSTGFNSYKEAWDAYEKNVNK